MAAIMSRPQKANSTSPDTTIHDRVVHLAF